jgi:imidazoleglycerol-phosphate dehydratase/histidinol-phosphatase
MRKRKLLFIDRDGTLIDEPADKQIDTLEKLHLEPGVIPALLELKAQGYGFVMLSNQDGLGTQGYPQVNFDLVQEKLMRLFQSQGITFEAVHICPHNVADNCECRKPRLGLVLDYLGMYDLDRNRSYVIGDRETDQILAQRMRLKGILYDREQNNWRFIVSQLQESTRRSCIMRQTKETNIEVMVDLDSVAPISISTSLGFFDHMLEQFAHHAGMSIQLKAQGDLQVDEHHLVEDTGLALGQALRQALGDKYGIQRYGFLLPMDDSCAEIALDLSGRPYFMFKGKFSREKVGELPTELVPHFFRSFAERLRATLHLKVQGENDHHQIESLFKGVGRAFRQAKRIEGSELPSTKGIL